MNFLFMFWIWRWFGFCVLRTGLLIRPYTAGTCPRHLAASSLTVPTADSVACRGYSCRYFAPDLFSPDPIIIPPPLSWFRGVRGITQPGSSGDMYLFNCSKTRHTNMETWEIIHCFLPTSSEYTVDTSSRSHEGLCVTYWRHWMVSAK